MSEASKTQVDLPKWIICLFCGNMLFLAVPMLWIFVRIAISLAGRADLLPQHDLVAWPSLPVIFAIYVLVKIAIGSYVRRLLRQSGRG